MSLNISDRESGQVVPFIYSAVFVSHDHFRKCPSYKHIIIIIIFAL